MRLDDYSTFSQTRRSSSRLQLAPWSSEDDFNLLPYAYLLKHGNNRTGRRKSDRPTQSSRDSNPSQKQQERSPPAQKVEGLRQKAMAQGHGQAELKTFNEAPSGDLLGH